MVSARANGWGAGRWIGWAAIGLTLGAFAAMVFLGRQQLRAQTRAQIIQRDAVILNAFALQAQAESRDDGAFDLAEPAWQYELLLRISGLSNIIAARLFSPSGGYIAGVPVDVREARLDHSLLASLERLQPVSRYHSGRPGSDLFESSVRDAAGSPPLLSWVEVDIPLHQSPGRELLGVAQFILEGLSTADEFAVLDAHLNRQTALALGVGGGFIALFLGWAFHRLERTNRLLAARTADLQRANRELAQAAKVSAVGAVTAHLLHSLRNPIAGLHSFVASQQEGAEDGGGAEWHEAMAATRRMQALIQQVTQVIRESQGEVDYELSLAEIGEQVVAQAQALAARRQVDVRLTAVCGGCFDNRIAGLLKLVLANLVQNGIEASPPGSRVTISLARDGRLVNCDVSDQGPGISERIRARLFEPVPSTKEGGSGIGLAISRQLAHHLGAELLLVPTSASGTTFRLRLPLERDGALDVARADKSET